MQFYLANSLKFVDYVTQIIITIITMKGEKRSKFSFHELLVPLQREIEIRSGNLLAALHMQCFCLYMQREVTMPDNTQQLRDPRSYQELLLLLHLHNMVFSPYVVFAANSTLSNSCGSSTTELSKVSLLSFYTN